MEINIGEDENDPVFGVSDLLVHLSAKQLEKKAAVVVEGKIWIFLWEAVR